MATIKNKKILVGITGSIAAYKICSLVNLLIKNEFEVRVIMTKAATKFVSPLTFRILTGSSVFVDLFDEFTDANVGHVDLAAWCNVLVIAPATANTICKIAMGVADNLLTTIILALPKNTPIILAPAMNINMWGNDIFQAKLDELLKKNVEGNKKYYLVNPQEGRLACGYEAVGKIAENLDILELIKKVI